MPGEFRISDEQKRAIAGVEHFRCGIYRDLDIPQTLDYYRRRYVDQIAKFASLDEDKVVADIGTGYGWQAMAFAAFSPVRLIAVDADAERLYAGRQIAEILGLADRIEWHVGLLGKLELPDRCADIVFCIEVLEHVYGDRAAIKDLSRLSRELVVLTTPNAWFPVIAHDTRLPFCHWLPVPLRQQYARACNRADRENDNIFFSAWDLRRAMSDFKVVSKFLNYKSLQDYLDTYPLYLPYVDGGMINGISAPKRAFYRLASLLGSVSQYVLPNIACVMQRRSESADG